MVHAILMECGRGGADEWRGSVCSYTSDMGLERCLADAPNVLELEELAEVLRALRAGDTDLSSVRSISSYFPEGNLHAWALPLVVQCP